MPFKLQLFESDELVLQPDGSLAKQFRVVGTNKVGMMAWHVHMKTPEYPGGRQLVIIANDVTFQSGSFGVQEVRERHVITVTQSKRESEGDDGMAVSRLHDRERRKTKRFDKQRETVSKNTCVGQTVENWADA